MGDVGEILDSLGVEEDVLLIEVWNKIDVLSVFMCEVLCCIDVCIEGV